MPKELYYLLALMAGAGISVQAGVNSQLRLATYNPILTALLSFMVGTALLLVLYLATSFRSMLPLSALAEISWWKWTGGILGTLYITSIIILSPRIGAANTIGFTIAGQLIFALVLDHFGLIGFPIRSVTMVRVAGVMLMLLGIYLVQKY